MGAGSGSQITFSTAQCPHHQATMSPLILLSYSLSPSFIYRAKKAGFYRRLCSQAASARIRTEGGSPTSWVDVQTTTLLDKKGGCFVQIPGEGPTPQPRGYAREEGNAHKHRHLWPRSPHWCCAENNSVCKERCGGRLVVTALPRAWERWLWIYQGLPVHSSLNKLRSSAEVGPRGSGANLCHCSALCSVVFPAWW